MRVAERINREKALDMLSRYHRGNIINPTKLEKYKQSILSGRWRNGMGMPIKFRKGELTDGHHRLTAIAETDCSIVFNVQYD